jgi:hypothetical protein
VQPYLAAAFITNIVKRKSFVMKIVRLAMRLLSFFAFSIYSNAQSSYFEFDQKTVIEITKETNSKTKGAKIIVFGESFYIGCNPGDKHIGAIRIGLLDNGFLSGQNNTVAYCEVLKALPFTEQVKVFKSVLFKKENDELRKAVIENVYKEVFGRPSTAEEFGYWNQKLTSETTNWYATMVTDNIKFLNTDVNRRTPVIKAMYQAVFGREPTADDLNYWLPRKEHYRLLHQAGITFLYSANAVDELTKTVKRAFQKKKPNFTEADVKNMLVTARDKKYSFDQMVAAIK